MIDFHTHILPGIDDGAKDISEALKILDLSYKQGVRHIIATPHFDAEKEDINEFLKKRQCAYQNVCDAAKRENIKIPKIYLGAEVKLILGLSKLENLSKLCINNSNYLLIEMPFNKYSNWIKNEVYSITSGGQIIPVMAHIDRYMQSKYDFDFYYDIFEMNVCFQINADCYFSFSSRRKAKRLEELDAIQFVGSDCHNMTDRKPCLDKCVRLMKKCHGKEFVERIFENSREIIDF